MGRLTADPELRQTQNGTATCRITVAVDRSYSKQGEEKQTDFITVVEFICRYFSKGRMIAIEGNIRTSKYPDKNHPDVMHYITEVYADQVHFTGEKAQAQAQQPQGYAPQPNVQAAFNNQPMAQATMDSRGNINMPAMDFEVEVIDGNGLPF